jgi:hypothetical protein
MYYFINGAEWINSRVEMESINVKIWYGVWKADGDLKHLHFFISKILL